MHRIVSTLALSLLLVGCGKSEEKAPAPKPEPQPATAPGEPAAPARPAPTDGGLQAHMQGHFDSIRSIAVAITLGNMQGAKTEASKLTNHQSTEATENFPEELQAVRDAASEVAKSTSLPKMAVKAAELASQCGHCHVLTSSIASFEWTEAPVANDSGADRMQRHQWAMDRLWEGLVGPSQSSWMAGAAILKADPVPANVLKLKGMAEDEANAKLSALQAFATAAEHADDLPARTALYGDLLGTCSACHTQVQAGK